MKEGFKRGFAVCEWIGIGIGIGDEKLRTEAPLGIEKRRVCLVFLARVGEN